MGGGRSSQLYGANCGICSRRLPPNNGCFKQYCGFYCFFQQAIGQTQKYSLAQKTIKKNDGEPMDIVFKYFRRKGVEVYKCAICLSRTQSVDERRNLDLILKDFGMIAIFPDQKGQLQQWQAWGQNFTNNLSCRLSAHPNGSVNMTSSDDAWQKWNFETVDNVKFFIQSSHGTYLRAHTNRKVDLTTNKLEHQIWTKVFMFGRICYQSYHGTYLMGNKSDGSVTLIDQPLQGAYWQ